MCGTRKEFSGDTDWVPPMGTVEASEVLAARWSVPKRGGHRATGITANRAQAGQLEVYTSCQDKGSVTASLAGHISRQLFDTD